MPKKQKDWFLFSLFALHLIYDSKSYPFKLQPLIHFGNSKQC